MAEIDDLNNDGLLTKERDPETSSPKKFQPPKPEGKVAPLVAALNEKSTKNAYTALQ